MARSLVVAHETVTNPLLFQQLVQIKAQDKDAEFTLGPCHTGSASGLWAWN
jgi:hypothetical protein